MEIAQNWPLYSQITDRVDISRSFFNEPKQEKTLKQKIRNRIENNNKSSKKTRQNKI